MVVNDVKSIGTKTPIPFWNHGQDIFSKKAFFILAKTNIGCTFAPLFQKSSESVAQQVEHIPFKDGVLGSSPSWFTKAKQTESSSQTVWGFLFYGSLAGS